VFLAPVLLYFKAVAPTATLEYPPVLHKDESLPIDTLLTPVVLLE
jgi:hypothetical protein